MSKFFQKQVVFLGRIFTAGGYNVDLSLAKPIIKFIGDPERDTAGVCRFLVLLGYFRRHIQSCCSVTRPIDKTR